MPLTDAKIRNLRHCGWFPEGRFQTSARRTVPLVNTNAQPFRRPSALAARLWYPLPSDVQLTVDLVDQDRDDHLQPDLEQKADGGCQRSISVGGVADTI